MCNLYSHTSNRQAILDFVRATRVAESVGNLAPQPGIFPDDTAPIVRDTPGGRQLTMARWGMPSPVFALKGKKADPGVTNLRHLDSPHWRRWTAVDHRCLVPMTAFSENEALPEGSHPPVWFAPDDSRPLCFFVGVWTSWTSVRKVKEGETTNDIYGFLTTEPNAVVEPIHPKAMPVILTTADEVDVWMSAPWAEAKALQSPCPTAPSRSWRAGRGRIRHLRFKSNEEQPVMYNIPKPAVPWYHPDRLQSCQAALEPALIELAQKAEAAGWNGDEVALAIVTLAADYAKARKKASETEDRKPH